MKQDVIVTEEKKSGFLSKAVKFTVFIAAAYGAAMAVARYMLKVAKDLEEGNRDNSKKKYLNFMNGRNLTFDQEEVEELSVDTCMGGVEVDLTKAELAEDTKIKLRSIMSGIVVKVPPMVNVEVEAKCIMGGTANMVPRYEEEGLKTIHIEAESIMAGIAIKMIPQEETSKEDEAI